MDNDDERTKVRGRDLIELIQRRHKWYLDRGVLDLASELAYILGRCTAHAEHIRPIQERGD